MSRLSSACQPYLPYCEALGGCSAIKVGDLTIFNQLTAGCHHRMRCCYFVSPHLNPVAADTVIVTAISHGLNKLLLLLLLLLPLSLSLTLGCHTFSPGTLVSWAPHGPASGMI